MKDILKQPLETKKVLKTPGMEEVEGFGNLPLGNLVVGREVPFDVFLRIKEKGESRTRLLKCCSRGEVFQEEWQKKLACLQISSFYYSMGDTARVFRYLQQNLETVLADEALDRIEKSSLVRDTTQMWTVNFFNNEEARTALGVKQSQQFLDMLFDSAAGDRRNLMSLMKGDGQKNLRLYNHCLNVALLGLAFTGYLGWSQGKSRGFAQGALVHDVGLTRIPPDILEKQGRLTQAEMLEIQCHPTESFRIVKGFVSLPYEAVQMVLQHHENVDGSGYPKGLKTPTIHSWALILRIIDSYEAMTAPRPWRAPMQPHEALVIMRREWEHNRHFDQNYLKAFIRFLAGN